MDATWATLPLLSSLCDSANLPPPRQAAHWVSMSTLQTIAVAEHHWRERRDRPLAEAVTEALEDSGAVAPRIGVGARVTVTGSSDEWLVISHAPAERGRSRLHVQSDADGSLDTVESRSCTLIGHHSRTPDLTLF